MKINNECIKLITNNQEQTYEVIKENLLKCKSFYFNVAFITWGGFQILSQTFDLVNKKNVKGKILTTSYQDFTDPKVMKCFIDNKFNNFEMKVVDKNSVLENRVNDSFHPKGYIFEFEDFYRVLIGSVNMTEKAMKTNVEWSLLAEFKKDDIPLKNILDEFNFLWNHTKDLDNDFVEKYSQKFFDKKEMMYELNSLKSKDIINSIKPNSIQQEALERLSKLRASGQSKALIIAATGVGKTYLSAFDVKNFNPKKILFVVHREEILLSAQQTYQSILKGKTSSIFKASKKETEANLIFASQQTLYRNLDLFDKNEFDYIVIDEAHHATAGSYLKVLNYFEPKFLLGMTATPERFDGQSIVELFGNNIAIEMRLKDAISEGLITTFHYFGITDLESIDLSKADIEKDIDLIAKKLMINKRVDYIIEKMNLYQYDGPKLNCIAFCINKEHAKFMCEEFNKRGIVSEYIISETPSEKRKNIFDRFKNSNDELSVIFVVDILNEGVDIPKINLVLFLRPTNSSTIFLQQLGRGLRKNNSKEFLTVLDFIANHDKTYLIPFAFASFNNVINEEQVLDMIKDNFKSISDFHIQFDSISQERILKSTSNINIYSKKWLKGEYLKFKRLLNRIPKKMCDYLIEGSPNLLEPILKNYGNYLKFLGEAENDRTYFNLLQNERFNCYLNYLVDMLPIYRINEFILILEVIKNNIDEISFERAKQIIDIYTPNTSSESIEHTFKHLNHDFYLPNKKFREKYKYKVFNLKNNNLIVDDNFKQIINDNNYKDFIVDCLEYGIRFFIKNFNLREYTYPFMKIGQRYKKGPVLFINQTNWSYDSFFHMNEGVVRFKDKPDHYYFLINFDENNEYENKVVSRDILFWFSPNKWDENHKQAKEILNQKNNGIKIHILIRTYKKLHDIPQPFIYIGKAKVVDYKINKPIAFKLQLEIPLSDYLFNELMKK